MRAAVLVPIKSFDLAKGRLSEALDTQQRASLARTMATRVLAAGGGLQVWVVCDDAEVASFAVAKRAEVIWRPSRGLNAAVTDGCEFLFAQGIERVVVAHADLPLATDLAWVADDDGITIVPDRRGDGTNVMSLPLGTDFQFHYGLGSAEKHRAEAERRGLTCALRPDDELGWDVDVPEDLSVLGDEFKT
ncbi:MAG: 2-phospho-L-lactate guanylyltransferase [Acidimicrobiales bacterium]